MRRIRGRSETGQSLVEMTVIVLIMGIVVAATAGAFLTVQRTTDEIDHRFENTGEAQKLIAAMSKDLRTATPLSAGTSPFLLADSRRVTFYGTLNFTPGSTQTLPNKVDLLVDVTDPAAPLLREYVWEPTNPTGASPIYNATATSLRIVGQYVANAASDPLFRYFDADGVELTSVPLSSADQIRVRSIRISLAVRKQTSLAVKAIRVENTVRLTNVIYGNLSAT